MTDSTTPANSLTWRKASASTPNGQCVELAALPDGRIAVRDSKDPDGPRLPFTAAAIAALLRGTSAGDFADLLGPDAGSAT